MKQTSLKVLTLVAVLFAAGLVVARSGDNDITLNQISAYRQWTRVNRKPVEVPVQIVVPTATIDLRGIDVAV